MYKFVYITPTKEWNAIQKPSLVESRETRGKRIASFEECLKKQRAVKHLFHECRTNEDKYTKIIQIGKQLGAYPEPYKTAEHKVSGCQSTMYLYASLEYEKVHYWAHSEALISAGLAALLLAAYNGEPPEVILQCPPLFLEELGIHQALSPSRANGLSSLFLKMKQEALQFYLLQSNKSL
jgi:cysteine desulfuration protein SufE